MVLSEAGQNGAEVDVGRPEVEEADSDMVLLGAVLEPESEIVAEAESVALAESEDAESVTLTDPEEAESVALAESEDAESVTLTDPEEAESVALGESEDAESVTLTDPEEAESVALGESEDAESVTLADPEDAESVELAAAVAVAETLGTSDEVEETESLAEEDELPSVVVVALIPPTVRAVVVRFISRLRRFRTFLVGAQLTSISTVGAPSPEETIYVPVTAVQVDGMSLPLEATVSPLTTISAEQLGLPSPLTQRVIEYVAALIVSMLVTIVTVPELPDVIKRAVLRPRGLS
jgi:hypothetical protein